MCAFVLSMFLISACGNGEPEGFDTHGEVIINGYFPWIEEVRVPDEVYAGEEFFYTTHIEAPLAASVLNGQEEIGINLARYPPTQNGDGNIVIVIDVMLRDYGQTGLPRTEYITNARFPVAGEHVIAILSAPTPEQGGMPGQYETIGFPGPRTSGLIYREFPVTVLPARETE
jgi:hypothetical protein